MARPYERIPLGDEPTDHDEENTLLFEARHSLDDEPLSDIPLHASSSSSSSSSPAPAPAPQRTIRGNDGVFANMAAKPDAPSAEPAGKTYEDLEPPSYAEVVHDVAPSYFETTVVSTIAEDGQILIEGMPIGNFFAFFVNLLVSMSFDFIGFLLTALMATSHAARTGSRCGLGITLIRYGFYIKSRATDKELSAYQNYDPNEPEELTEQQAQQSEWAAYILVVCGFFLILRANADYVRVRRLQNALLAEISAA
ncbi:hypothetical protein BDK51DRAFT_33329 [Blyttiomyces helicus]|uniref:Metal homeostatis protein bsd2 n=1 Tax=Blyttiomyces helicus TaxID=388810 RepID=A0A4P9WI05_9FUNG|nr:hypothetical protein BDK51DRAFT_33329 [Blyttiomyces helicus]|eukprot:RKO91493.1 hypothetical protein BDK51DRAFT_33329 [Blyttiomyces helicus]